jgi:hypothetical protein
LLFRLSRLKLFVPHIIVIIALSSILVAGYTSVILQTATPPTPKVTWEQRPLTISFSATVGSGNAQNRFTCNPSTGPIVMRVISNAPTKIQLSVSPLSFTSCGSIPQLITVTATCLVPALECRGNHSGLVQVRQPINYRNLADTLQIRITVS